eukprot:SAG25_NODE_122_length_14632_cov_129.472098_14_plen_95_part_00
MAARLLAGEEKRCSPLPGPQGSSVPLAVGECSPWQTLQPAWAVLTSISSNNDVVVRLIIVRRRTRGALGVQLPAEASRRAWYDPGQEGSRHVMK